MALGEQLFEECGKVTAISVRSVHSVEGVKMEVSLASEIAGIDKFPSGRNMGSSTMTRYPHGTIDASYHSVFETKEGGQFFWWAHDKSRVAEGGGRTRGRHDCERLFKLAETFVAQQPRHGDRVRVRP